MQNHNISDFFENGLPAITAHMRYLRNDPHMNRGFAKVMRPTSRRISKLLEDVDFTLKSVHDPHLSSARRMNGTGFLAKFLHEFDDARVYLLEAEAKTIPTKNFIEHFAEFCKKNLPSGLFDVKFDQLYHDGDKMCVAKSPVKAVDADKDISPMVCLAFPYYTKDKAKANALVRTFIESAVNDGYFLSYSDLIECRFHDGLPEDVSICYLTFEAKYTSLDIALESNLFHVTTEAALPFIAKNGLLPKAESKEFNYPPRIFLFNKASKDLLLAYGREKAKQLGKKEFYVIRIEKNALENNSLYKDGKIVLYLDPAFSQNDDLTDSTALFTYDKIPVSLLNDVVAKYGVSLNEPTMMKLSEFR